MTRKSKSLAIESIIMIISRFLTQGSGLIVLLILARSLSLHDFGLYSYVFSISILASTALDFGTRHSVSYYLAQDVSIHQKMALQTTIWSIIFSVLGIAGLVGFLGLVKSPLFEIKYILPVALGLPALLFIRVQQGVALGRGWTASYTFSESFPRVSLLLALSLMSIFDYVTLESALWAVALTNIASAIYLQFKVLGGGFSLSFDRVLARKILNRGLLYLPGVFLMIASKRAGVLIAEGTGGPEAAGLYFGYVRIAETLTDVALAIGVVLFSHSIRAPSVDEALENAAQTSRTMMLILLIASIVFVASSPWLVPIVLGKKFAGGEALFALAVCGGLVGALWTILYPALSAVASPIVSFWVFLPGVTTNIVLTYILGRLMGPTGFVFGYVASQLLISAGFLFAFWRLFGMTPSAFLFPKFADFSGALTKVKGLQRRLIRS